MAIEFTSKKVSVINPEYAYVMRHMDNEPSLFTGDFLHKEVLVAIYFLEVAPIHNVHNKP